MTEKGKFCPHASPISGCSSRRDVGCLLALAGQYKYKPLMRFPFWGLPSVITRHCETAEQGSMLASCRAYHPFTQAHHRVSKAENLFTEKAERQLSVFLLWPEDPGPAPKVMAYGEQCRIHDLRRRFSFRTRDQAWSLKSFCVAVLLRYEKGQRKVLTQTSEGGWECPPCLC